MTTLKPLTMEQFQNALKKKGLKVSSQRLAVHTAMLKLGHACVDMVARQISREGETKVTVASVYNTLSQLADLGIYSRRTSANNKMYFDVMAAPHAHMYDIVNNIYRDVMTDEIVSSITEAVSHKRFRGFTIEDVDIQFVVRPTQRKKKEKLSINIKK